MDLPTGQRVRGVVLSPTGQAKLQNRMLQLEIERYAVQELVRRSQLVEGQGLHPATIRKILRCQGVDKDSIALVFKAVNLQLELEDYTGARRVLELAKKQESRKAEDAGEKTHSQLSTQHSLLVTDWGEAVDVTLFCGRSAEISTLQQWVLNDHCRLVALLGNGGIGKTTLVTKLAEEIQNQFEFLIWRSLRNAPLLPELLDDLLKVLSSQQTIELPNTTAGKISKLMEYLRRHRCLLVLDNLETLMQDNSYAGSFQIEYEGYSELLQRVSEVAHQSCLLITSREKPNEIAALAGEILPVRSLQLTGLNTEAQEILTIKGLSVSLQESQQLIDLYSGNPLALKIVATAIKDLFSGDASAFLATGISSFNSIRALLNQQFERLTQTEKSVMYWLAINRESVALYELADDIYPQLLKHQLLEAVESILRRSLIEQSIIGFTQQPVIMEYVTERFMEQICAETVAGMHNLGAHNCTPLLITHAIVKATAKDYIKDLQIRLIVKPLIADLLRQLRSKKAIAQQLMQILARQREQASLESGYLAGNILNLLHHLETDLSDYDFSHLPIWQADLRAINLHGVNFTNAHFSKSVFRQIFGSVLSAAFSPDGEFLATGDDNGEVHLWRVADGQMHLSLKANVLAVQSLCFSLDGQTLISHSADQSIQYWDINTGQTVRTIQRYTSQVLAIAPHPTGNILVSRKRNQTVSLWDLNTGKSLATLQNQSNQIQIVALSPDSELLATAGGDEPIRLWNAQTGEYLHSFYGHRAGIQSLAWSDKRILATGSDDHTVKLWDIETAQCISTLSEHSNSILSINFSSDGLIIASGSADQTIRLWDVVTGNCLRVLSGHENWVRTVVFNADSAVLATGGDDQVIRLWDTATGQCLKTLQGYTNQVSAIGYCRDAQLAVRPYTNPR